MYCVGLFYIRCVIPLYLTNQGGSVAPTHQNKIKLFVAKITSYLDQSLTWNLWFGELQSLLIHCDWSIYKILVRKSAGKVQLGRTKHEWVILKLTVRIWTSFSWSKCCVPSIINCFLHKTPVYPLCLWTENCKPCLEKSNNTGKQKLAKDYCKHVFYRSFNYEHSD